MARKSWAERRHDKRPREIKKAPKDFAGIKAGELMLLPSPRDVETYIRTLKTGRSVTTREIREGMCRKLKAGKACPVVTGIHLRALAESVGEELEAGLPPAEAAPAWRALPPEAPLWKKLENGKAAFRKLRKAEGLEV